MDNCAGLGHPGIGTKAHADLASPKLCSNQHCNTEYPSVACYIIPMRKMFDSEPVSVIFKAEASLMDQVDAYARATRNGATLDKILSCLDSFTSKLDSLGSRMDSYDKVRADGAEAAMVDKKKDAEEIEEKGDPKELKADAFADSDENRDAFSRSKREPITHAVRGVGPWKNPSTTSP